MLSRVVLGVTRARCGVPGIRARLRPHRRSGNPTAARPRPLARPRSKHSQHRHRRRLLALRRRLTRRTTIVFDLLGDLYTMPITGGDATPLTSGMPFDAQPRFSPDGKIVVFTSDRDGGDNVWIMDVATKQTQADHARQRHRYRSPEWTPDGNYIVVARAHDPDRRRPSSGCTTRTLAPARSSSAIRSPCSPATSRSARSAPRSARTIATSGSRSAPARGSTTPVCRSIRS